MGYFVLNGLFFGSLRVSYHFWVNFSRRKSARSEIILVEKAKAVSFLMVFFVFGIII
jgi:hypothetical protein